MKTFFTILLILMSFLIILYLIVLILYNNIFKRSKVDKDKINNFVNNIENTEHRNMISKGMDALNKLPKEDVYINSYDNITLCGHLIINHKIINENNTKIIIFCHGYHSVYNFDFSMSGIEFYNKGYNLLFIDQRAHEQSLGKYTTFGIKERFDLQKWIEYVDNRFSNNKKIILCGISMGASTVMYTLGLQLSNNVIGAICDCGYTSPMDIIKYTSFKKVGKLTNIIVFLLNLIFIARNGYSLNSVSTMKSLKENKIPILIIHGGNDKVVPVDMADSNYSNVSKGNILKIPNAGHGMSYLFDRETYLKTLNDFLNKL